MNNLTKPVLESKTQSFINAVNAQGGKPIYEYSPVDARKVLEDLQAKEIKKPAADIEDKTFPTGPTGEISVRIYRPVGEKGVLPVVLYFHGGGWILGSKNTHDRLLRDLVNGTKAAFVFVNYTLSPEAQFPIPIEQGYAALDYVAKNAEKLGFDPERIAIAGDSAGGEIAAVLVQLAKQRKGPTICYQVLFYPVTDANFETGSYQTFDSGYWLSREEMKWFWNAFAPNLEDRKSAMVCPLLASVDELKGLPPTLLIVDENDVLRDEGEAYARKLMQAGVDVTATRILGAVHDFAMLNPLANTPAAKVAIELACEKLNFAFGLGAQKSKAA
jgi:acetyl esterase